MYLYWSINRSDLSVALSVICLSSLFILLVKREWMDRERRRKRRTRECGNERRGGGIIPLSIHLMHFTPHTLSLSHTHTHTHTLSHTHTHTHTHTLSLSHTHTHLFHYPCGDFHRRNGFLLYRPYILSPYTNPTPKLSPHRRHFAFLDFQKT